MPRPLLFALPCLLLMACTGLPLGETDPWPQGDEPPTATHTLILTPDTIQTTSRWTNEDLTPKEVCRVGHHDGNTHRCMLRFTLDALPADATLLSATLHLRTARVTHLHKEEVFLRAATVQAPWDADKLRWDALPATGSPHHDIPMHVAVGGEDRFTLSAMVQRWIQNPAHNHGVSIQSVYPGQAGMKSYQGFKDATLAQGPRLHIVYRRPSQDEQRPP